jgi:PAS domain S-box-containing protein
VDVENGKIKNCKYGAISSCAYIVNTLAMDRLSEKFVKSGFSFAILLLGGVAVAAYFSIQKLQEDKQWVIHTYQVMETLDKINIELGADEVARRDLIMTKEDKYLHTYNQEKAKVYQALTTLRYLTKDNPIQQNRLSKLEQLINQRFTIYALQIHAFKQNRQDTALLSSVTNVSASINPKIKFVIDTMNREEDTLLKQRNKRTDKSVKLVMLFLLTGSIWGLFIVVLVCYLLQRQLLINNFLSNSKLDLEKQAAKAKLAEFLESTTDAFVALDKDWKYTYVNQRAGQLFNRNPDSLIGKNIWSEFPEGIGQKFQTAYSQAVEQQEFIQIEEYYPPWDSWYENRIYPSKEGLSIFFQNITPRKHAELALQQAKETLEIKVKERTAQLQDSLQELERSNQELENFAHIASHDLQEPLRAIIAYSYLLKEDYSPGANMNTQKYIEYITDGATRMRQLIKDLLTYSRVNRNELQVVPVDCNLILAQIIDALKILIAETNADITYDQLPTVNADKNQLTQLFLNLISNAIKFRCSEQPKIHIKAIKSNNGNKNLQSSWLFSVSDNGIGIKTQYLERIFDIFRRLHTSDEYPGTGIGLAICKKIVERHGGSIWAESVFGDGTTFYFILH